MFISHIMQFIRHVMFKQLPALIRSKSLSRIFHVSCWGVKVSSEVIRSLLFSSLTCRLPQGIELAARANEQNISFLHSPRHLWKIYRSKWFLVHMLLLRYKISYKWLQVTSPCYQMCHSAIANKRSLFPRFITAAHARYVYNVSRLQGGFIPFLDPSLVNMHKISRKDWKFQRIN